MHRIDKAETFLHAAFAHQGFNRWGDVYKTASLAHLEPEVLGQAFHALPMPHPGCLGNFLVWREAAGGKPKEVSGLLEH